MHRDDWWVMQSIAIFGGTFDPVHNGHIKTSIAIQQHFAFDRYCFLPCKNPTLKPPTIANSQQRVTMLELAIKESAMPFTIDLREINRDTPSYMVDTLKSFRVDYPDASITLILGYDAFISLPQWFEWKQILGLANLLAINRNAFLTVPMPESIKELLSAHKSTKADSIRSTKTGIIYEFDAGNYSISSSELRVELKKNSQLTTLLPQSVYQYIKSLELYQ